MKNALQIDIPKDGTLKRAALVAVMALATMGCGANSDLLNAKPGPPLVVTAAQASGAWTFTLTPISGSCAGGGLPAVSTFQATLDFGADGKIVSEGSFWKRTSTSAAGQLTGSVQLTTGLASLTFLGSTSAVGAQLTGAMSAAGSFTGQLKDPATGLAALFAGAPCEYNVTGARAPANVAV